MNNTKICLINVKRFKMSKILINVINNLFIKINNSKIKNHKKLLNNYFKLL